MRKHLLEVLLLVLGVATIAYVVVEYREVILTPLWSFRDTAWAIAITFALRRVQRPIWALFIMLGVVELFGFAIFGHYRRLVSDPIKRTLWWFYKKWSERGAVARVTLASVGAAILGLIFWFATYRLATVMGAWVVMEKIYYWIGDQLLDRGLPHWRLEYWLHRWIHRVPWLRKTLAGARNALAGFLKSSETRRSERLQHLRAWRDEHRGPDQEKNDQS